MKLSFGIYVYLFYLIADGYCIFQYTNIGKFGNEIYKKIQNHTLTIPRNQRVDNNVFQLAFQGFRNVIDDPLIINEQLLNYEMRKVVKLQGYLRSLQIKYLKKIVLNHFYISEDNLYCELIVTMPLLEIIGLYNASCYVNEYNFDLYGNGSFKWLLNNFTININFTFDPMKTEYMQLQKSKLDHTIGSSKFQINNILNDDTVSSTISEIITIVLPFLHNYFKPVINEFVIRIISLYSEIIFSNLKHSEFVGIIHAFKDKAITENLVSK